MKIRPIKVEELRSEVEAVMLADGHSFPSPTHYFVDEGAIIGALGLGFAPVLFMWMHSTKATKLHSYRAHLEAIRILQELGHTRILLPIQPASPFCSFIDRLGYHKLGDCQLFGLRI